MTDDPVTEAAEYVLGTLDPVERAAFAQRLAADPALQTQVADLSHRFTELLEPLEPLAPSPAVWVAIRQRLDMLPAAQRPDDRNVVVFPRRRVARRVALGSLAAIAALLVLFVATRDAIWPGSGGPRQTRVVAQDAVTPSPASDGHGNIASVRPTDPSEPATGAPSVQRPQEPRHAGGAVVTAGAAPGLGSVSMADDVHELGTSRRAPAPADSESVSAAPATVVARDTSVSGAGYVAVLAGDGTKAALTVRIDPRARALHVGAIDVDIPAGKALTLWYSRNGGPFKPIGVVAGSRSELPMPAEMTVEGSLIGASLEPSGGPVPAGPATPMLYQGAVLRQ